MHKQWSTNKYNIAKLNNIEETQNESIDALSNDGSISK